jgi:hypothetical protein
MSTKEGMLDDREDAEGQYLGRNGLIKAYFEVDVGDNDDRRQSLWHELNTVRGSGDTCELLLADTWS